MTFAPKMTNLCFYPKSDNIGWIDVRLRIIKLESGGQQLPVTKKNLPRNIFNLEKSCFFINT